MTLEVLGAGFGRTGTNSLKHALEQLGFGPCHHMHEVRDHPEQLPAWDAASRGEPVDWHQVFAGYRSQVDWPGARYWRELAEAFPDAKVVLSLRDPDSWFDSIRETITPFLAARGSHDDPNDNARAEMAHRIIDQQVFAGRMHDRDHAIRAFEAHIEAVQSVIPPQRLLSFNVREGWQPLCDFLGVSVPDTPFPRTNSKQSYRKARGLGP